ncbi:MAG: radical SAM protein [bacterium]
MNIWLVRPASSLGTLVGSHSVQHPIGLCYLGAAARGEGWSARVVDCEVERWKRNVFARELREGAPDVVGFTAMTPVVERAAAMARVVKDAAPRARTVLGGAHASALPVETMREFPCFDALVAGEGESKFVGVCGQAAEGRWGAGPVAGCVFRTEDGLADYSRLPAEPVVLDALPLPARDLLNLRLYRGAPTPGIPHSRYRATMLFTSRGCTGKCTFCAAHATFGRRVRLRSVESLAAEIRQCIERFGFRHFTIDDDSFTVDRDRVIRFCREVSGLKATWDCDARVDQVDRVLLNEMADSGCLKIAYGVESGSRRILDLIGKEITVEQIEAAFRLTREAKIMSCAFLMLGSHPGETRSDVEATRALVRRLNPDLISVAITTPFPGTAHRAVLEREAMLPKVPWTAYSQTFVSKPFTGTKTMTPSELQRLQRAILLGFFLRPRYLLARMSRLGSAAELRYWLKAGFQFLIYILTPRRRSGGDIF